MKKICTFLVSSLLFISVIEAPIYSQPTSFAPIVKSRLNSRPSTPSQSIEAQLNSQRVQLMQPTKVIELMNLRPELTVLDLGAGRGMLTFPLADQVGKNGKVFATDIDGEMITFLQQEIKKNYITNVFPVLVQTEKFDSFYSKHSFDVIVASEVVPLISNIEELFGRLATSLKPESGRLWIIVLRVDPNFSLVEFGDFTRVKQQLSSSEGGKFLLNQLQPELKKAIASQKGDKIPESLQIPLVEDFNRLLNDRTLWTQFESQFSRDSSILNPREKQLRDYLVAKLNQAKVFNSTQPPVENEVQLSMRLLNRLLIQDILQTKVWEEAFSLDQLWWEQWQGLLLTNQKMEDFQKITEYQLVQEHDSLIYHQMWEFKRSNQ